MKLLYNKIYEKWKTGGINEFNKLHASGPFLSAFLYTCIYKYVFLLRWRSFIVPIYTKKTKENSNNQTCPCEKFYSRFWQTCYRAFYRFGQAKFPNGGSILGSSQFSILPQLPLKMILCLKVVKIDSKISNPCL